MSLSFQDSIFDMLVALEGILQAENERMLNLAADVTLQLVKSLGKSICQYPMLEVIISLSHLLSLCVLCRPRAYSCSYLLLQSFTSRRLF